MILDEHMDGVKRGGCRSDDDQEEEMCDICRVSNDETVGDEDEHEDVGNKAETMIEQEEQEEGHDDIVVDTVPVRGSQSVSEVGISQADIRIFRQEEMVRSQPRKREIDQTKEQAEEWRKLGKWIKFWHGKCPICIIAKRAEGHSHDLYQCRAEGSREAQEIFKQIRSGIVYTDGAACRNCGVPLAMCNRFSETRNGVYKMNTGKDCQYRGTIISTWVGIMCVYKENRFPKWERRLIKKGIEKEFHWDFTRGGKMAMFLGERIDLNREGVSRIALEFCKLATMLERVMELEDRRS